MDIVAKAINNFYVQKNYQLFKEKCNLPLNLPKELKSYIEQQGLKLMEYGDLKDDPSKDWRIQFNQYEMGKFEVSYETELTISRVAPVFYIYHSFDVEHKNKNLTAPDLGYCGGSPYTKQQAALHDQISTILKQKGYVELREVDLHEAVEGFTMPRGVTIFGKNMDVEILLFRDFLGICDRATSMLQKQGHKKC